MKIKTYDCISIDDRPNIAIIDDALLIYKEGGKYFAHVFVADIASTITLEENTALLSEAMNRVCTKYYLSGHVEPMIPFDMVNRSSLKTGLKRKAFCFKFTFDAKFEITDFAVEKCFVVNKFSLSDKEADQVIDGHEWMREKPLSDMARDTINFGNIISQKLLKDRKPIIEKNMKKSFDLGWVLQEDGQYARYGSKSKAAIIVGEFASLVGTYMANFCQRNMIPIMYLNPYDLTLYAIYKDIANKLPRDNPLRKKLFQGYWELTNTLIPWHSVVPKSYNEWPPQFYSRWMSPLRRLPELIHQLILDASFLGLNHPFTTKKLAALCGRTNVILQSIADDKISFFRSDVEKRLSVLIEEIDYTEIDAGTTLRIFNTYMSNKKKPDKNILDFMTKRINTGKIDVKYLCFLIRYQCFNNDELLHAVLAKLSENNTEYRKRILDEMEKLGYISEVKTKIIHNTGKRAESTPSYIMDGAEYMTRTITAFSKKPLKDKVDFIVLTHIMGVKDFSAYMSVKFKDEQ